MKVAILGYDREGEASYRYFSTRGDDVVICDRDASKAVPEGVPARLGDGYLDDLEDFDLLVRTPGLPPRLILEKFPDATGRITSGTNEFFEKCPSRNIIGVTGTKGKGTTSTMIARMLEAAGRTVHLGGNIGVPALTLLPGISPEDWVVLELSSFQLIDLHHSPHIAVCLMVVPEHQDWHTDLEEYLTAKEQLFAHQLPGDVAIYYHDSINSKRIAGAGQAQKVPYYHRPGAEVIDIGGSGQIDIEDTAICRTDELKLLGHHNWQNACAAVTAVWYAAKEVVGPAEPADVDAMRQVLTTFTGLPFRIEFRREVDGIRYYNDSFASAPPAPIAAIEAIPGKQVVIIGGFDRNLDLGELIDGLKRNVDRLRNILVIGAAGQRIADSFRELGLENFVLSSASDMTAVVKEATVLAQPGDAVVLSPGFPSFDMFKNFEDRGRQFNEAVEAL